MTDGTLVLAGVVLGAGVVVLVAVLGAALAVAGECQRVWAVVRMGSARSAIIEGVLASEGLGSSACRPTA